ncbi:MAG: hypothetical protein WD552_01360 [Candidatus Paceibacterota bacterium]
MESVAQMDIFFFVTTLVVIVSGVLLTVFLVYAIKFIRDVKIIMDIVREEAAEVIDDIDDFRRDVSHKAKRLSGLLGVVTTARFIKRVLRSDRSKDD